MFYFLLHFGFIDVAQSRFARVGPYSLVGSGTSIGDYSFVINSTIGDNCIIGRNVSIEGCYIWNNVTIQDNCKLKHAIVCDGVILKTGAVLQPGVILTFKVVLALLYWFYWLRQDTVLHILWSVFVSHLFKFVDLTYIGPFIIETTCNFAFVSFDASLLQVWEGNEMLMIMSIGPILACNFYA